MCDGFKYNGSNNDVISLWLFPFSLKDKAKHWLNSKPLDLITTWADLVQKFLAKFFPLDKTLKMRIEIKNSLNMKEKHSMRHGISTRNF